VSCNTTYAQVGFDLGDTFAAGLPNFGVATTPPPSGGETGIDPAIAKSSGPAPGTFQQNQPAFMQDAIGQNDVAVTPLEMAMVAEAVASGGTILAPHFVECVKDPDDRVISTVSPAEYKHAIDGATAATMKQFMLSVVNDPRGTGTAAQIPGVQVAGKTGTAETAPGEKPHAWFIEFAPADAPRYAIAVLVEHGGATGGNDSATGGRVAAPVAKQVMQTLLSSPPAPSQCGGGGNQTGNGG
jgi:peptidoglycan glycosyltransferase